MRPSWSPCLKWQTTWCPLLLRFHVYLLLLVPSDIIHFPFVLYFFVTAQLCKFTGQGSWLCPQCLQQSLAYSQYPVNTVLRDYMTSAWIHSFRLDTFIPVPGTSHRLDVYGVKEGNFVSPKGSVSNCPDHLLHLLLPPVASWLLIPFVKGLFWQRFSHLQGPGKSFVHITELVCDSPNRFKFAGCLLLWHSLSSLLKYTNHLLISVFFPTELTCFGRAGPTWALLTAVSHASSTPPDTQGTVNEYLLTEGVRYC